MNFNPLHHLKNVFVITGKSLAKAFKFAVDHGLTDQIIAIALPYVKLASTKYVENKDRREWVISELMKHNIPEGISGMALELALKLYKDELAKLIAKAEKELEN